MIGPAIRGATCGCEAQGPIVQCAGERESGCLPCDLNDLVRGHVEGGDNDRVEIASMMVESLADLVLLASDEDRANLMAHAISAVGQMILETSGAFEGGSSATH